jgi:hypothetical protein
MGTCFVVFVAEEEKRAARRVAPQRAPATGQEGAPAGASHEGGVEATGAEEVVQSGEEDAAREGGGEKLENPAVKGSMVRPPREAATRPWTTFCDVLLVYGSQWRVAFGKAPWLMMGA